LAFGCHRKECSKSRLTNAARGDRPTAMVEYQSYPAVRQQRPQRYELIACMPGLSILGALIGAGTSAKLRLAWR